jgi:hypothetical protein
MRANRGFDPGEQDLFRNEFSMIIAGVKQLWPPIQPLLRYFVVFRSDPQHRQTERNG